MPDLTQDDLLRKFVRNMYDASLSSQVVTVAPAPIQQAYASCKTNLETLGRHIHPNTRWPASTVTIIEDSFLEVQRRMLELERRIGDAKNATRGASALEALPFTYEQSLEGVQNTLAGTPQFIKSWRVEEERGVLFLRIITQRVILEEDDDAYDLGELNIKLNQHLYMVNGGEIHPNVDESGICTGGAPLAGAKKIGNFGDGIRDLISVLFNYDPEDMYNSLEYYAQAMGGESYNPIRCTRCAIGLSEEESVACAVTRELGHRECLSFLEDEEGGSGIYVLPTKTGHVAKCECCGKHAVKSDLVPYQLVMGAAGTQATMYVHKGECNDRFTAAFQLASLGGHFCPRCDNVTPPGDYVFSQQAHRLTLHNLEGVPQQHYAACPKCRMCRHNDGLSTVVKELYWPTPNNLATTFQHGIGT